MATAFITGITGQDGGYLADALLEQGWSVHGLVLPHDPALPELLGRTPQVRTHEGDLGDQAQMAALIGQLEPDEIYNLGGISSVALSWDQPLLTSRVTGFGAAALLEAAFQTQLRLGRPVRFVQASSAEIFGSPEQSPQTEQTPIRPQSPYGVAKAYAHAMVGVYRTRGLMASSCILYNHESPRRPETFVTRKITKAAALIARGEQDVLKLGNLDARRDWGWAPDYVEALIRANRYEVSDNYVIATGQARSVREFAQAAFERAGVADWEQRIEVDEAIMRPVDASEQVGDARKARVRLGWAPSVSFADMVARMVDADLGIDDSSAATASG
ncbi:MAG: GDP-mannose 4,6-dehydratase [Jatrophihabitantaceae bacterium]